MGILENYLSDLRDIKLSGEGVSELSYYPALRQLLEEVGGGLKPKVRCLMNLKNHGAGLPDGGLFTADQIRGTRAARSAAPMVAPDLGALGGQKPARGAIEVKPPSYDAATVAKSPQVLGYLEAYRQVLVTTLREFLLLGLDEHGKPVTLESYSLAPTEAEFWSLANHPRNAEKEQGARFLEFLKRVLLSGATLASPQDLAWFLASYAREARFLVESAELPALDAVRKSMEETLGVKFEGAKGEHFFRSTLVQTLFYGLFASWVLWSHEHEPGDGAHFEWRQAAWTLRVPVVQALFTQIATPNLLGKLGLVPVLNLAAAALNRVDRRAFFSRFEKHHAVQYFYEPFLEAFDPELRKELGVWYTPPEIVEYMVARVDTVLREELGVPDGLADPNVYVLDPCCGTGAYLVEVLERISQTLDERGSDALVAGEVKKAAMKRVFGFEILPAPFVIAHMQLGLLLQNMHLPLEENERVGVFLTNALTGWESPHGHQQVMAMPELEAERDAAEDIKQNKSILVVLGNPPYNGYAGMATAEERGLTDAYRTTKKAPAPQGQGLNDLYVRFFRMAERRIVEKTGKGIVCFISNYSWLDGLSFTGMRERYLEVFDKIWIDNLHGDRIISEYAPDGRTSETVFAMGSKSPGIKIGTAIALLCARSRQTGDELSAPLYRDFDQAGAIERRETLLRSARDESLKPFQDLEPKLELGLPFMPRSLSGSYLSWPLLPELLPLSFPGIKTSRDDFVLDVDRERLETRMRAYFNPDISDEEMRQIAPKSPVDTSGFAAKGTRAFLVRRGFLPEKVVRYYYRPFDVRWLYWEPDTKLLDRNRPDYFAQAFTGNIWIEARQRQPKEAFDRGNPVRVLADQVGNGMSSFFPLLVRPETGQIDLESLDAPYPGFNVSATSVQFLVTVACGPDDLFFHCVCLMQSPSYREENQGALRQQWPRIPLPDSKELLLASAELGRKVADLLDPETEVDGVTTGSLRPELKVIGVASRVGGGNLNEGTGDLAVSAGWGHTGRGTSPCRAKEKRIPDLGHPKSGRPSGKDLRPWASAQRRRTKCTQ